MFAPTPFVRRRRAVPRTTYIVAALATFAAAHLLLAPSDAAAQERQRGARAASTGGLPPIIPLTHFFDNPEITGAQISPDGRWLSYLKPWNGKLNIHIRPADQIRPGDATAAAGERRMTSDTTRPVVGYFWSADGQYLLYVQDKGGNENYHVYKVPVAGSAVAPPATDLTPVAEGVRAIIFAVPRDLPGRVLIGLNQRDRSAFDAYWLDLATGRTELAAQNPGRLGAVFVDRTQGHRLRAAVGSDEKGGTVIYERDTDTSQWRPVVTYPVTETVRPLRLHRDGRRVYMASNHGATDLQRLVLLDLETGDETPIESDPKGEVDFGNALFSERTGELLATVYVADTVRIYPRTPEVARDLQRVRRLHDGTPNLVSATRDETKWIVAFDSPTDPGATYLYDRTSGRGRFLFRPRPWLKPNELAGMRPVSFKARDGLTIHGYLTTPVGVAARNLPLVLVVHGGPWARDTWGYDAEAQLLANRGYAVLQINYRGSTGYGKKFYNAAVKEWAGKMHTDLVDGVQWAIREGITDASKVAIYGGSYGGYATLVGLTFTPEVFACGVDYVGPSSLITLLESFPAYWRPFLEGSFYYHIGNPADSAAREDMRKRSPLFFIERIQDPLLVVQGANDPRVTKREADQIVTALRDRGVKVQYLLAANEGHGFLNPENRLALYRAMELFFRDCLGGRAQDAVTPAIEQQIRRLAVNVDTLRVAAEPKMAEPVAVRVGDASITTSHLRPASHSWRVVLVQGGQEREVGTARSEVTETTVEGAPALQIVQSLSSPMMGNSTDTVVVLRQTVAPVRHRSTNARRTLSLDFERGTVKGTMTPAGGTAQPVSVTGAEPLFDSGALEMVVRSLPLAEGYAATFPVYLHEAGGAVTVTARVTGSERVTLADGTVVDSWVVENDVRGQKIRQYIAKDSREVVRTVIVAAPGVELRVVR
jgi:dipeptidyl aminopeptidase/acylaminoacyl peptidase